MGKCSGGGAAKCSDGSINAPPGVLGPGPGQFAGEVEREAEKATTIAYASLGIALVCVVALVAVVIIVFKKN